MATESMKGTENIEKLIDSESFKFWKFQTTVIFKSYGIYEVVKGQEKFEDMITEKEKRDWKKKDATAQKLIVTSVDKKLIVHILNDDTSHGMYSKLCKIFEQEAEQQKCNLLQDFFNFKYDPKSDMTSFIANLQNMAVKLKSLNQNIDDDMLMSKMLSSLPDKFKHFVTAWESTSKTDRTLANLTARLISEEIRSKSNETEETAVAFKTKYSKSSRVYDNPRFSNADQNKSKPNVNSQQRKCFVCKKPGHLANACPSKNGQKSSCSICNKQNHCEKDCYFRKNKSYNNNISFLTSNEVKSSCKTVFVLDSGCTAHMSNDVTLFRELDNQVSEIMIAKSNESMKSEGQGKIEGNEFDLKQVLYVPELSTNLLSVNKITENGGKVLFTKDKAVISKNDVIVCEGTKQSNGLYVVSLNVGKSEQPESNSMLAGNKHKLSAKDWHIRLGHPCVSNMLKLVKIAEGIDLTEKECVDIGNICEVCVKSKQTRMQFSTERKRADRPLQIIHTDLCGPIEPRTWDGKRYVLTLMDDFTHYTEVELLENKHETFSFIKDFVYKVEAMQNLKVSTIRCDNGGEYTSNEMKTWCQRKGIVLDYTIPHTPQLNGKAERLNRTLMEKGRALIFDSGIDKQFWGEAVRSAAYLLNRTPCQAVNTTPVEEWFGRKTDVSKVKRFGCDGFVKILGHTKKLDPRCEKMVFIGYAKNGYRMWDPQREKIVVSRDVVFDEWRRETDVKVCKVETVVKVKMDSNDVQKNEENRLSNDEQESQVENEILENGHVLENQCVETRQRRPVREVRLPRKLEDYAMMSYREAVTCLEKEQWKAAIEEEKLSLSKNETWEFVDKSEAGNSKILSNKWVFTKKDDGRYKARLVVRGCEQKGDFDYEDIFSPVVGGSSLRTIFSIANQKKYNMLKFDVKTAFLYGDLKENVFMKIPDGYKDDGKICKLKKALYGLRQAPLTWNRTFTQVLKESGLIQSKSDKCVFKNEDGTIILALYVDDGIVISDNEEKLEKLIKELKKKFEIKEEKNPRSFLGMEVTREKETMKLSQDKYTQSVLQRFNMANSKSVATPCEINTGESSKAANNFPFREAVGNLLYLSTRTRPDIAYSVNMNSRCMENPTEKDIVSVKRVMKYLVGTQGYGIKYHKSKEGEEDNVIEAFCDSDFAGDINTRRSTTGYVIYYGGGPISWCSRRQPIVALSSTEAEYIAAADCCKEVLYLKSLIEELTQKPVKARLNVDNQSAITLMKSGTVNKRSKHIDVRFHFIHEKVMSGEINVQYCPTNEQIADCLTKPLSKVKFHALRDHVVADLCSNV